MQYEINLKSYSTHASQEHSMPSATWAVSLFPTMHVIQPCPFTAVCVKQPCALQQCVVQSCTLQPCMGGRAAMHEGGIAMHGGRLALQASPCRGGGCRLDNHDFSIPVKVSRSLPACCASVLSHVSPLFLCDSLCAFCAWETFYLSQVPNDDIMSQ